MSKNIYKVLSTVYDKECASKIKTIIFENFKEDQAFRNKSIVSKLKSHYPDYSKQELQNNVNITLSTMVQAQEIFKIRNGIYALNLLPNWDAAEGIYVKNSTGVYGLYYGSYLTYKLGLSNEKPERAMIESNLYNSSKKYDGELNIEIKKTRKQITKENYNYYTTLNALKALKSYKEVSQQQLDKIKELISEWNLEKETLTEYAKTYPKYVQQFTTKLTSEMA